MVLGRLILAVYFGTGLSYLPIQTSPKNFDSLENYTTKIETQNCVDCNNFCTIEQLKNLAKSITVKVISENSWGSGIMIRQQGEVYTVITNQHVLDTGEKSYHIQTPDGLFYQANKINNQDFQGNDLALLEFRSTNSLYKVASLGNSTTLYPGNKIFAAGFPTLEKSEDTELLLTRGRVSILSDIPLEKGYQIGYTNVVRKGMSGGPLLNIYGQVVGINGMHAYPLWGNPYIYNDGSQPTLTIQKKMSHLAFAIPIATVSKLAPQFASLSTIEVEKNVSIETVNDLFFPDLSDFPNQNFLLHFLQPSCPSKV